MVVYGIPVLFLLGIVKIDYLGEIRVYMLILPIGWWAYLGIGGGKKTVEKWLHDIFG
jgi:hypothetical protein